MLSRRWSETTTSALRNSRSPADRPNLIPAGCTKRLRVSLRFPNPTPDAGLPLNSEGRYYGLLSMRVFEIVRAIKSREIRIALSVAITVDALQILALPLF